MLGRMELVVEASEVEGRGRMTCLDVDVGLRYF